MPKSPRRIAEEPLRMADLSADEAARFAIVPVEFTLPPKTLFIIFVPTELATDDIAEFAAFSSVLFLAPDFFLEAFSAAAASF